MISKFKVILISCLIYPCTTFALTPGDYFQQGLTVVNESSQNILITDPSTTEILNYQVNPEYQVKVTYPSDQFTNAAGQTFSHTITINSGINFSLICTVTSSLYLSGNSTHMSKPTSSDESKCKTGTYLQSGPYGLIYGFKINVIG
jgi:uncharacterized membrane protein